MVSLTYVIVVFFVIYLKLLWSILISVVVVCLILYICVSTAPFWWKSWLTLWLLHGISQKIWWPSGKSNLYIFCVSRLLAQILLGARLIPSLLTRYFLKLERYTVYRQNKWTMGVRKEKQKYRGMFESLTQKSGNKTSSGEIGLNISTLASPEVGQGQVSGGESVLCWHAAPVAKVHGNLLGN